jgi:hypothetical protein
MLFLNSEDKILKPKNIAVASFVYIFNRFRCSKNGFRTPEIFGHADAIRL